MGRVGEGLQGLPGDVPDCETILSLSISYFSHRLQLHTNEGHPDKLLLEHVRELIRKLDSSGVKPSPSVEADAEDDGEEWEDETSEGDGEDIEMEE
jgi:hypothetical protein